MGRRRGRRHYPNEIRLVKIGTPNRRRGMRRRMPARAVMLLVAFMLSAAGLGKLCALTMAGCSRAFAPRQDTKPAQEKRLEEILGEPVHIAEEEIVMLSQEEQKHVVAIDAGHGGEDDGCYRDGVSEAKVNLELAKRLDEKLRELGFETVMIREDDETFLNLEERISKAAGAGADIYVSIHQNAYDGQESGISGIETWYSGDLKDSSRLAELVHNGAVRETGACDRNVRETDELYVVREASMPSCLIETSFLSDDGERAAITSERYQEKLADGMAQGIDLYFHPKTTHSDL